MSLSLSEVLEQLAVPGWRGFSLLRRYRRETPGPCRALARQLRSVPWQSREDYESRRIRFAFVGSSSLANLEDVLLLEGLDRGIVPEQHHSLSRQPSRELRDPGSALHRQESEVVVVAVSPLGTPEEVDSLADDLRGFRTRSAATLVVSSLVAPEFWPLGLGDWQERSGHGETCARLNLRLAEHCRGIPDAHIVDVARLLQLSGARWWTLHRSAFLAGLGVPEELAVLLARDYAAVGAARRGFVRKCLALDLDDTLWGGVVGEIGAQKVDVGGDYPGNIYRAIQQLVRQLREKGVLLAINSRNNEDDAWEPFRSRPEMVLEQDHFAAWRINWRDKAANMRELAQELRLGLDSFVLLDNDPMQQAYVEDQLPEVHVIPAQDPLDMLHALASQRLFDGLSRTAEDALRAGSYAAAARRRQAETSASDREAFLASLGMVVSVGRASPAQVPRLAQLTQRTNQFNLTTRRYSEGQISDLLRARDAEVLCCSCRDRFAEEGIVGLAILRSGGEEWVVDSLLLSCRVLGWGVEKAFGAALCAVAGHRGATSIVGEYVPTAKNSQAKDFYTEIGFSPLEVGSGRYRWRRDLPLPSDPTPKWIAVAIDEGVA